MELKHKHIVVVGLGKTGMSVARFLTARGAHVTVTDNKTREALGNLGDELNAMPVTAELGGHSDATLENADLIVLSPGVPHTLPPLKRAISRGIPVIGEIELASRFIREPMVAVTGTNGKTTTTTLIGEILSHSGFRVFTGGNIGTPLIDYVDKGETADVLVVETSSFQLDTIDTFRPRVGVLLNITEDHLDRYDDFNAYAASKMRLFKNQIADDTAIFLGDDPRIRTLSAPVSSRRQFFGGKEDSLAAATIENRGIHFLTEENEFFLKSDALPLVGRHNMENIAAAGLAALAAGAAEAGIRSALSRFRGLPHRIEHVDTIGRIRFYDDSKATNVDAVLRALDAFDAPVILILGGRDKGGDFTLLREHVTTRVKTIIALGEATPVIHSALSGTRPIRNAATMSDAVHLSYELGEPGDIVLLSPGCASFDMYNNYAERGEDFRRAVLKGKVT